MKNPIAEIFSQGEEVVNGQVADTNAAWLSQHLVDMGFTIGRHTAVGDKLPDLIELLTEISQRADLCICTGGLGPTIDDLTAEAVATAFNKPLQLDTVALSQIEDYFSNRNRQMAGINRKQAYFPHLATRVDNAWGTAPGFALQYKRCWFVFLPGVPTEMKNMFRAHIKPLLNERFVLTADKLFSIKSVGIGESELQQKINTLSLPDKVQLSFRATTDEVQTKLLFPADMPDLDIKACVDQVVNKVGDVVYAVEAPNQPSLDLISVISQKMIEKEFTLSLIETATQGLISAKCIGEEWLIDSSYQHSLQASGIESQNDYTELALGIAHDLRQKKNSDLVLVQLYQGNKKQFQNKVQSIVLYNVLLTPHGIYQNTIAVVGPIKRKQNQAAMRALDLLRRYLQQCH